MNTLSCVEKINPDRIQELLDSTHVAKEYHTYLKKLKKSLKNGEHKVTFAVKKEAGRLFPQEGCCSVQGIERNIRKYLMCEKYTDIDIVNAHPVILSQEFKKKNIDCPLLDKYVKNREPMLQDMITTLDNTLNNLNDNKTDYKKIKSIYANYSDEDKRDLAKLQFIRIMYLGTSKKVCFSVWKGDKEEKNYLDWDTPQFLKDFETEFKRNADAILRLSDYGKDYIAIATKSENAEERKNPLGGGLSYLAQDLEKKIVLTVMETFTNNDYVTSTIIHDGFLVESLNVSDQVLRDSEKAVKNKLGYEISLVKKSMIPDSTKIFGDENETTDESCDDRSHTDLAIAFLKEMEQDGHRFIYGEDEIYWFRPPTETKYGVYEQMNKKSLGELRRYINASTKLPDDTRGGTKFQNEISTQLIGLVETDHQWRENADVTIHKKIPFKNGVYCCDRQELIPYDHSMYFTKRGLIEYQKQSQELVQAVYNKILLDVYGDKEKADYVLALLARCLAGEKEDRVFVIVKGLPSSGKSSLTDLAVNSFQNLCGIFNAGSLCAKTNSGDIAKRDSWKVSIKDKRLVMAHECPTAPLEGEMIKNVASGGDYQQARQNNKDEKEFKLQGIFWAFFNKIPQFRNFDWSTKKKVKVITTYSEYLDPDEMIKRKKQYTDAGKEIPKHIKPADPTIKQDYLKREDVQQAFAQMVCEAYRPTKPTVPAIVDQETDEYLEQDDFDEMLKGQYEETADEENKLYLKDLEDRCKKQLIYINKADIKSKIKIWTGRTWKPTTRNKKKDWYITNAELIPDEIEEEKALHTGTPQFTELDAHTQAYLDVNTYPQEYDH